MQTLFTRHSLLFFAITISNLSSSCDICNIFEYANRRNQSYVGVFYRQRFFNGYDYKSEPNRYYINPASLQAANARENHVPEEEGTQFFNHKNDFEMYQTIELRGNYAYKKHWNFQLIIPYVHSQLYYKQVWQSPYPVKDSSFNINGFGDAIVAADYTHTFETGWIKHIVKPGLGLKIPTGKYNAGANSKTYGYDIQPGTSSVDIIARLNYLITNDKWGADVFLNYRYCTKGENNVQFGNKWNAMANFYYTLKINEISFLPKIGNYYEFSERDKLNGNIREFTGGYTWFYQAGIDIMYKQFIVQTLFQKPYAEKLNGQVIGNAGRLMLGVVYNFE